ncbi:MAG: hypothetical protein AB7J13_01395 [Pyrinomonadaceae bacterium]
MTNVALENTNAKSGAPPTTVSEDGYVASETGTEKEKPADGRSNVQGQAFFNEKPAAGVEVKLCRKFSSILGCRETQYSTKTDDAGEYLIKDVEPGEYEGLIVKVFDTPRYVFAARSFGISAAKYKLEANKTFFAPPSNLFKSDLKVQSPKAAAKIDQASLDVKWDAYPDAAYYKISFFAKEPKIVSPYINIKVEDTSFKPEKPLANGEWRIKIDAFNANEVRLSQLNEDLKFTVSGGAN